jgi:hypothetical protein
MKPILKKVTGFLFEKVVVLIVLSVHIYLIHKLKID